MPVSIPDEHRGTDGDESSRLATLIGTLVRMHAPFGMPTWAKLSNSIKEYIRERVLEKMVEIQSQSTTESGAPKDVDIFTQVLGTKSGYVRRLGHSVKPIAASSSTVSIQRDPELVCELEATKATIEELKSRQSKYDNLKNNKQKCRRHRGKFKSNFNYLRHNLRNEIRR
ncbi:hypothetical protein CJ030_MR4G007131 [Morella rubra]|uniref:Uncharacterized protein n=1 Tax=Morella rubra TaxID=262757 RepID=A0A6A1VV55_9ROSI|nr:hypothetical protein CJ030_MR4G007131 [Morella rubra]